MCLHIHVRMYVRVCMRMCVFRDGGVHLTARGCGYIHKADASSNQFHPVRTYVRTPAHAVKACSH